MKVTPTPKPLPKTPESKKEMLGELTRNKKVYQSQTNKKRKEKNPMRCK